MPVVIIDTTRLDALEADLVKNPRALTASIGGAVEELFKDHFLARNQEGNKRGWPRSNFWSKRIRANTALTKITSDSAEITIASREFLQKIYGGKITPKESKYLALPAVAEAANKSPKVFSDIVPIIRRKGGSARAVALGRPGTGSRKTKVLYWLVKSVTQQADARALPPDSDIGDTITAAVNAHIDRITGE